MGFLLEDDRFCTNFCAALLLCILASSPVSAHPHDNGDGQDHSHANGYVHENGIGPDPDNDSNPATITGSISVSGGAAEYHDAPPHAVVNFEVEDGHGDEITDVDIGLKFFPKVTRQICAGIRHFRYDSACTYEAAPSGEYAAVYLDYLNRPLIVEFDTPVCVVTTAIYPTGGKQDEEFEVKIEGWSATNEKLDTVTAKFKWRKETVRWRQRAGAYYLGAPASKIAISMKSNDAKEAKNVLRFLIDDFAIVSDNCEAALADIARRDGAVLSAAE